MLSKLLVRNYAIIDTLEVAFSDHFNIITGETGAGKSILVGALGLVLGDRADVSVLRDNSSKAIVEAVFTDAERPAPVGYRPLRGAHPSARGRRHREVPRFRQRYTCQPLPAAGHRRTPGGHASAVRYTRPGP
ncbi:MAG: hypothetical protein EBZ67_10915 [Chitinophagia bacterium]|nr:hypothetical protein [Chitinophagia bacterium]